MPRPGSTIIHPRMLAATNRWTGSCDIERAVISYDAEGQQVFTWQPLFSNVACVLSTNTNFSGRRRGEERRTAEELALYSWTIELAGVLDVTPKDRATVDGKVYDVIAVDVDSQQTYTRLYVEVIS